MAPSSRAWRRSSRWRSSAGSMPARSSPRRLGWMAGSIASSSPAPRSAIVARSAASSLAAGPSACPSSCRHWRRLARPCSSPRLLQSRAVRSSRFSGWGLASASSSSRARAFRPRGSRFSPSGPVAASGPSGAMRSRAAGAAGPVAEGAVGGSGSGGRLDSAVRMALLLVANSLLVHVRLTLTQPCGPCNIVHDPATNFSTNDCGKKSTHQEKKLDLPADPRHADGVDGRIAPAAPPTLRPIRMVQPLQGPGRRACRGGAGDGNPQQEQRP
jgi:hypothetical protein